MRRWLLLSTLVVLCGVHASDACASEGGGADLIKPDWTTIATSVAIFLVLLVILSKTAWKPILAGLQKREDTIRKALDDAQDAHERAKALIAEYEAKIDHAREEAQSIFEETRRDAQEIRDQIQAEARVRADETLARATREIEQLHAKAWDRLVKDAASIAGEAAKRIIQRELTPEGHAEIVASVVSDFAARGRRPGGGSA